RDEVRFSKTTQKLEDEIRRLNERIADIRHEHGKDSLTDEILANSIERLSVLIEELIRSTKESDRKLSDELTSIRSQIYKSANAGDIATSINAIKNKVNSTEDYVVSISSSLEEMSFDEKAVVRTETDTELLRQIYEIKNLLGSVSPAQVKRNEEILELYNLLSKVKYEFQNANATISDKYETVDALAKRLSETTETDILPVASALNAVIDELGALPLDVDTADDIFEYVQLHESFNIPNSKKEAIRTYLSKVSVILRDGGDNVDELPDLIATKNSIQSSKNEFECERIYATVLNTNIAVLSEKDPVKAKTLRAQLKEEIEKLTLLQVRDLIDYPKIVITRPYRTPRIVESEGLFGKLNEIKNAILDAGVGVAVGAIGADAPSESESEIEDEIASIKKEIYGLNNIEEIGQSLADLKADCIEILARLDETQVASGVVVGAITLEETIAQLDRLFDDIKNLASDCENSIMSSLEVIGDAIASVTKSLDQNNVTASQDRAKLLEDVAFIRNAIENSSVAPCADAPASASAESVDEETLESGVENRLTEMENNQKAMMEMLSKILEAQNNANSETLGRIETKLDEIIKTQSENRENLIQEIKLLRDQLFAVSMANVTDEGEQSGYESYNTLILNEIYAIQDALDALASLVKDPSSDEKIAEEVSELRKKLNTALNKDNSAEVMGELKKIKDSLNKRPVAPAPKPAPKKKVTPIVAKDVSISELLSKIGATDAISGNDD
ncbi:MAG: hypothetical protein IKC64_05925, partial [Clostridia bacterium]|nr:hypothetical protein [Clostridia bacterium]